MIDNLDTLNEVSVEGGILPEAAFQALHSKLKYDHYGIADAVNALFVWGDSSSAWAQWNTVDGAYAGTWPKRFAKYMYKNYGVKLTEEVVNICGDVLGKYAQQENTYYFEITKFMDWTPGNFKERSNSCWWNTYNSSRLGLKRKPEGFAILFYKTKEQFEVYGKKAGIGRCFAFKTPKGLVIFNCYGLSGTTIATVLSKAWNKNMKKIEVISPNGYINAGNLNNEGGAGGNKGVGYIIGDDVAGITSVDIGDISLDTDCLSCGREISSTRSYKSWKPELFYCELCASKSTMCTCQNCGGYQTVDERRILKNANTYAGSIHLCQKCEQLAPPCEKHGRVWGAHPKRIWHTSHMACEVCIAEKHVVNCTGCGHLVSNFTKLPTQKPLYLCSPCMKKTIKESK